MLKTFAVTMIAAATHAGSVSAQQGAAANNLFTASGFVVQYANTPEKLAHLKRLPPDKLVVRSRGGKKYYMYADPNICQCAYVGSAEAYRNFQNGAGGFQPSQGSGESRFEQGVDEFNDDYVPSVAGAPSFDDYVFGGMKDD